MKHIEKLWNEYSRVAGLKDAPESVLIEIKLAFFSGATSIFGVIIGSTFDDEMNPKSGGKFLQDISNEANKFIQSIMDGAYDYHEKETT